MQLCDAIDWEAAHTEALGMLKALIRFKTVNPPGNEGPAADWLAQVLRKDGLEPEVLESAKNRANVVCRLKGSGEKPPLLLNGHLDVVDAEEENWSCDPFEPIERNGCLYGRGAVDMKNMVAMCLMCLLLLKRSGASLKRDLIFCGVADEEAGGRFGSRFMVDEHPEKVRAEYSLGEMGGFSMQLERTRFYPVQVAEKGVCWIRIKTSGKPGHGSIPNPDSALIRAAKVAEILGTKRLPQHNTEVVTRFVKLLSGKLSFPKSVVFRLLLNPLFSGLILDRVMSDKDTARLFSAMLHNTANPTVMSAGEKTNVISSGSTLEVDGRLLPGFTSEDLIAEMRGLIGEEPELEVMGESTPTVAPADDPIFAVMTAAIGKRDPGAVVVPNLLTGFTDATHWKELGMKCYGFSPLKLPPDMNFPSLCHGHDERIPLEGFRFGLETLFEVVAHIVT